MPTPEIRLSGIDSSKDPQVHGRSGGGTTIGIPSHGAGEAGMREVRMVPITGKIKGAIDPEHPDAPDPEYDGGYYNGQAPVKISI